MVICEGDRVQYRDAQGMKGEVIACGMVKVQVRWDEKASGNLRTWVNISLLEFEKLVRAGTKWRLYTVRLEHEHLAQQDGYE